MILKVCGSLLLIGVTVVVLLALIGMAINIVRNIRRNLRRKYK